MPHETAGSSTPPPVARSLMRWHGRQAPLPAAISPTPQWGPPSDRCQPAHLTPAHAAISTGGQPSAFHFSLFSAAPAISRTRATSPVSPVWTGSGGSGHSGGCEGAAGPAGNRQAPVSRSSLFWRALSLPTPHSPDDRCLPGNSLLDGPSRPAPVSVRRPAASLVAGMP